MNLYEINNEIQNLINPETGEVSDYDKLVEMNLALETKKENIALYIKNLTAEADAIKTEVDSLTEREKAKRTHIEKLTEYLSRFLEGQKFETARVKCCYRKSTVCEIDDESVLMIKYPLYAKPQPPKIAKAEIKTALKNGIEIDGARLVDKLNLQIV